LNLVLRGWDLGERQGTSHEVDDGFYQFAGRSKHVQKNTNF
jgi:hypothetical protein